jgi:hypothetical protein
VAAIVAASGVDVAPLAVRMLDLCPALAYALGNANKTPTPTVMTHP